jgi:hypothetical protein
LLKQSRWECEEELVNKRFSFLAKKVQARVRSAFSKWRIGVSPLRKE